MMEWHPNDEILLEWVQNDGMTSKWWDSVKMSTEWWNDIQMMRFFSEYRILTMHRKLTMYRILNVLYWVKVRKMCDKPDMTYLIIQTTDVLAESIHNVSWYWYIGWVNT